MIYEYISFYICRRDDRTKGNRSHAYEELQVDVFPWSGTSDPDDLAAFLCG